MAVNVSPSISACELKGTSGLGQIDGCGWVIESDSATYVDDMQVPRPAPTRGFPMPFFSSVEIGHGLMHLSGPPARLVDTFDTDALQSREFRVQTMSKLVELDSTFGDGTHRVALCASHLKRATWRLVLPQIPEHRLILRKTFDQFHGRQRAGLGQWPDDRLVVRASPRQGETMGCRSLGYRRDS